MKSSWLNINDVLISIGMSGIMNVKDEQLIMSFSGVPRTIRFSYPLKIAKNLKTLYIVNNELARAIPDNCMEILTSLFKAIDEI